MNLEYLKMLKIEGINFRSQETVGHAHRQTGNFEMVFRFSVFLEEEKKRSVDF